MSVWVQWAALIVVLLATFAVYRGRELMIAPHKRSKVRVHFTDSAPSIEGILLSRPGKFYRLAQAEAWETSERSYTLEGEVFVPRERVLWVQVVG